LCAAPAMRAPRIQPCMAHVASVCAMMAHARHQHADGMMMAHTVSELSCKLFAACTVQQRKPRHGSCTWSSCACVPSSRMHVVTPKQSHDVCGCQSAVDRCGRPWPAPASKRMHAHLTCCMVVSTVRLKCPAASAPTTLVRMSNTGCAEGA
jgi:hypothetical protein